MTFKTRRHIEKRIAHVLIKDALAAGYEISVDNGGLDEGEELDPPSSDAKAIKKAMFATDWDRLHMFKDGKDVGWVWFVYGNEGWDVIADYTTNLEHIMEGANKESDEWGP